MRLIDYKANFNNKTPIHIILEHKILYIRK